MFQTLNIKFIVLLCVLTLTICPSTLFGKSDLNKYSKDLERAESYLQQGDLMKARKLVEQIISIPDDNTNSLFKGYAYRMLAETKAMESNKTEQIDLLLLSLQYFKSAGNLKQEGETSRLIGHFFIQAGLYSSSKEYLNRANQIATNLKDTILLLETVSNQAQFLYKYHLYDSAIALHNFSLGLAKKVNYRRGIYENYNRISYNYWEKDQYEEMLDAMQFAKQYAPNQSDTLGIMFSDLGLAHVLNGNLDSAGYYLKQAQEKLDNGKNLEQIMYVKKYCSILREKQGRLEESLSYLKEYNRLYQTVYSEKLNKSLAYIQTEYQNRIDEKEKIESKKDRQLQAIILLVGGILLLLMLLLVRKLFQLNSDNLKKKKKLEKTFSQLKMSRESYKQLFDSNLGIVMTHDLEGVITSVNNAVTKLLGYEKDFIIGKSVEDFLQADYKALFANYLKEIKSVGMSNGFMNVVDNKGKVHTLKYRNVIAKDPNGEHFVIGSSYDQTEFNATKSLAQKIQKRIVGIASNSPDLYVLLDLSGKIRYVNQKDSFLNRDHQGQNIFDILKGKQKRVFLSHFEKCLNTNSLVLFEDKYGSSDVLGKLIPITDSEDNKEVIIILTDITELKHNQKQVETLSTVLRKSHVGVIITDVNENVTWINDGFTEITGYQSEQVLGRNPGALLSSPNADPNIVEYMTKKVEMEQPFKAEVLNSDSEGRDYWVKLMAEPIYDEGNFNGYFFIQSDITKEKFMITEIIKAKEEAERSNKLKTIFLGSLSHEVRTPLQGILGITEILEQGNLSLAQQQEYLNLVKTRSRDVQNIIEALLDIASLESGEIKSSATEFDLGEYVKSVVHDFSKEVLFIDPSLKVEFVNQLTSNRMVEIDQQHLKQVLNNLLYNASKFSDDGKIEVKLIRDDYFFKISVRDEGIGIEPDKLEDIFTPFRQADEGFSRSKGGIGLGLSISKKMVELWGGEISVTSEPGKGSTFSINIPDLVTKPQVS